MIFMTIENKKAIIKKIDKNLMYSRPRKRSANKYPLIMEMNLNILNILLNSNRG